MRGVHRAKTPPPTQQTIPGRRPAKWWGRWGKAEVPPWAKVGHRGGLTDLGRKKKGVGVARKQGNVGPDRKKQKKVNIGVSRPTEHLPKEMKCWTQTTGTIGVRGGKEGYVAVWKGIQRRVETGGGGLLKKKKKRE